MKLERKNSIRNNEARDSPNLDKLPDTYKTIPDDVAYYVKTPEIVTKDHEILDVDHKNQQEIINILKQEFSGITPILDSLENLSAAGSLALYSLYEHAWDEVNLKMKIARMTHHKNRREKNMKFTTGWKKNKETNEALTDCSTGY